MTRCSSRGSAHTGFAVSCPRPDRRRNPVTLHCATVTGSSAAVIEGNALRASSSVSSLLRSIVGHICGRVKEAAVEILELLEGQTPRRFPRPLRVVPEPEDGLNRSLGQRLRVKGDAGKESLAFEAFQASQATCGSLTQELAPETTQRKITNSPVCFKEKV